MLRQTFNSRKNVETHCCGTLIPTSCQSHRRPPRFASPVGARGGAAARHLAAGLPICSELAPLSWLYHSPVQRFTLGVAVDFQEPQHHVHRIIRLGRLDVTGQRRLPPQQRLHVRHRNWNQTDAGVADHNVYVRLASRNQRQCGQQSGSHSAMELQSEACAVRFTFAARQSEQCPGPKQGRVGTRFLRTTEVCVNARERVRGRGRER